MMRSPLEADRRLCRPAADLTGRHSSIKYSGAAPTRQCRTRRTILNSLRFLIGSRSSSSRMAAEIPMNFAMFITKRIRIQAGREDTNKIRKGGRCSDPLD